MDTPRPDRLDWNNLKRASTITIPARAHPLAKLVYSEMQRQGVTYPELEHRSGVLVSTFKAWRTDNAPGLATIEAALGALGWALVPVPRVETLPADLQLKLEEIGLHFRSDADALGAAIAAAAAFPVRVAADVEAMRQARFA